MISAGLSHALPGHLGTGSITSLQLQQLPGGLSSSRLAWASPHSHLGVQRAARQSKPYSTNICKSLTESHFLFFHQPEQVTWSSPESVWKGTTQAHGYREVPHLASRTAKHLLYQRFKSEQTDIVPTLWNILFSHLPSGLCICQLPTAAKQTGVSQYSFVVLMYLTRDKNKHFFTHLNSHSYFPFNELPICVSCLFSIGFPTFFLLILETQCILGNKHIVKDEGSCVTVKSP